MTAPEDGLREALLDLTDFFSGEPQRHLANWRASAVADEADGKTFGAHPLAILALLAVVDAALRSTPAAPRPCPACGRSIDHSWWPVGDDSYGCDAAPEPDTALTVERLAEGIERHIPNDAHDGHCGTACAAAILRALGEGAGEGVDR